MDVWAGDGKREGPPQRFMIGGLIPGIQYRHRVRARNRAGWSPFSPAGSTTRTKALPPDRIGTPEVTSLESRRIVLEWVAPITNGKKLTNYEVQHREASIEEYEEELEMLAYEKAEREAAGIHDDDDDDDNDDDKHHHDGDATDGGGDFKEGKGAAVAVMKGIDRGNIWAAKVARDTEDPDGLKGDDAAHVDLEWKTVTTPADFKTSGNVPPPCSVVIQC